MSETGTFAANSASTGDRLVSLDQFRGYTVAGMFLVNFIGSYAAVAAFLPTLKHWNNHCSYADTVMPQFLFAVGFSFRMSYLKRREQIGARAANVRVVRRILGLLLVALVIHQLDGRYGSWSELKELGFTGFFKNSFRQSYFQTLAHIGCASLWVVPVIGAGATIRMIYMVLSGLLFVWLSASWYYHWVMTAPGIDGGALGFITWATPLLLGTLAFDISRLNRRSAITLMFVAGSATMLIGYALSCLSTFSFPNELPSSAGWRDRLADNPFVRPIDSSDSQLADPQSDQPLSWWSALTVSGGDIPRPKLKQLEHWVLVRQAAYRRAVANGQLSKDSGIDQLPAQSWQDPDARYLNMWTMSQRSGSWPYMLFGGGLSLVILAGLMILCDVWGWQLGLFRTLGVNALLGYILHDLVNGSVRPFVPSDAPLWYVFAGFSVSFGVCYLMLRTMEKQGIFLKL